MADLMAVISGYKKRLDASQKKKISIDTLSMEKFPRFTNYLKEKFGERVSTRSYSFEENHKIRCPIVVDGKTVGSLEEIYSLDGKRLMNRNAQIRADVLGAKTDAEFVSLMYYVPTNERTDNYDIPFP